MTDMTTANHTQGHIEADAFGTAEEISAWFDDHEAEMSMGTESGQGSHFDFEEPQMVDIEDTIANELDDARSHLSDARLYEERGQTESMLWAIKEVSKCRKTVNEARRLKRAFQ